MDQEEKAYTTFFISTIYRALKLPNPFDGLLEKFDKDIPIQIRLYEHFRSVYLKLFGRGFVGVEMHLLHPISCRDGRGYCSSCFHLLEL